MSKQLALMWQLAKIYHDGQMYGDLPYMHHIRHVYAETKRLMNYFPFLYPISSPSYHEALIIAVGHDLVEDTEIDISQIEAFFDYSVTNSIFHITKMHGESRTDYLNRCSKDELALFVKIADTRCNRIKSIQDKDEVRILKYLRQLDELVIKYRNLIQHDENREVSNDQWMYIFEWFYDV